MAITKVKKHDKHQVAIIRMPKGSAHFAELRCADCCKHIQWLGREDYFLLNRRTNINNYITTINY